MSTSWPTIFLGIRFVGTGFTSKIFKHQTHVLKCCVKIYNAPIILFNLIIIVYYFQLTDICARSINRTVLRAASTGQYLERNRLFAHSTRRICVQKPQLPSQNPNPRDQNAQNFYYPRLERR